MKNLLILAAIAALASVGMQYLHNTSKAADMESK